MNISKNLSFLVLLCGFGLMPMMSQANSNENYSVTCDESLITEALRSKRGDCSSSKFIAHKGVKKFHLNDFKGVWVFEMASLGGSAGPNLVSKSAALLARIVFGAKGNGDITYAAWSHFDPNGFVAGDGGGNVNDIATIRFIDEKQGSIKLSLAAFVTYNSVTFPVGMELDGLAIRDPITGRINEISLIRMADTTQIPPTFDAVATLRRQN